MLSGIYMIWNSVSRKAYVGSAVDLQKRRRQHWSALNAGRHHNRYLQRAWGIGSPDHFEFIVLKHAEPERLLAWEQYFIDYLGASDGWRGYNGRPKAESNLGAKWSEETKEKIRRANLGKKQSPELIEKRMAPRRGRPLTEAEKCRIAALHAAKLGVARPDVKKNAAVYAKFDQQAVWAIDDLYLSGLSTRAVADRVHSKCSTVSLVLRRLGAHYGSIPYRNDDCRDAILGRLKSGFRFFAQREMAG